MAANLTGCLFYFSLFICVFIAGSKHFLVAASWGYSRVAMGVLLIVVASLVAEHGALGKPAQ